MPLRIWADSFLGGATDGQRFYAHPYNHDTANSHHITKLEWLNVLPVVCAFVAPAHKDGIVEVYYVNQPVSLPSHLAGQGT